MKVLQRYLSQEIRSAIFVVLLVFMGVFAFFDFIGEIDNLGKPGTNLNGIALTVLFGLPARLVELMPIAVLIGGIYAFAQLASHSEFTVLRAAGFSPWRSVQTTFKAGFSILIFTLIFAELAVPAAEMGLFRIKALSDGVIVSGKNASIRNGQWLRDTLVTTQPDGRQVVEYRFVYFRDMSPDGRLQQVEIFQFAENRTLQAMWSADSAYYQGRGVWVLQRGVVHRYPATIEAGGSTASRQTFSDVDWLSSITPDLLSGLYVEPQKMSAYQLWRYRQFLVVNQQNVDRIDLALARKAVYPFALMVMLLIALPFGYLRPRAGGVSVKIFVGIMLGIGFHLVNNLFAHLSQITKLPPLLSAGLPAMLGLLGALFALWWVQRVR